MYKIIDWAGNDKSSYYGHFETFEDAWERLYIEFNHLNDPDFSEYMGEFEVVKV